MSGDVINKTDDDKIIRDTVIESFSNTNNVNVDNKISKDIVLEFLNNMILNETFSNTNDIKVDNTNDIKVDNTNDINVDKLNNFKDLDVVIIYIPNTGFLPFIFNIIFNLFTNNNIIIIGHVTSIWLEYMNNFKNICSIKNVDLIKKSNILINTLVLHDFHPISYKLFDLLKTNILSEKITLLSYSDGSKNIISMLGIHMSHRKNSKVIFHNINTTDLNDDEMIILNYDFLYKCYPVIKENIFKEILSKENINFVVLRYYGTGAYKFKVDVENLIINEIKNIPNISDFSLHIKDDGRVMFDTNEISNSLSAELFSSNIKNNDYLLENILLYSNFLDNVNILYSFDSSFPLMLCIPELYKKLKPNIKIYVGCSNNLFEHGTEQCINTIKWGVSTIIWQLLQKKIFYIYSGDVLLDANMKQDEILNGENFLYKIMIREC